MALRRQWFRVESHPCQLYVMLLDSQICCWFRLWNRNNLLKVMRNIFLFFLSRQKEFYFRKLIAHPAIILGYWRQCRDLNYFILSGFGRKSLRLAWLPSLFFKHSIAKKDVNIISPHDDQYIIEDTVTGKRITHLPSNQHSSNCLY